MVIDDNGVLKEVLTKEELVEFLSENLKISIDAKDYTGNFIKVIVGIKLEGKIISSEGFKIYKTN